MIRSAHVLNSRRLSADRRRSSNACEALAPRKADIGGTSPYPGHLVLVKVSFACRPTLSCFILHLWTTKSKRQRPGYATGHCIWRLPVVKCHKSYHAAIATFAMRVAVISLSLESLCPQDIVDSPLDLTEKLAISLLEDVVQKLTRYTPPNQRHAKMLCF